MIRKLLTYLSLTLLLIGGGCSSDEPLGVSKRGDASLTLLIPSTVLSRATGETRGLYDTRDAGDTESDHQPNSGDATAEGAIKNNFYVVAFYNDVKDNNKLKYFKEELTPEMGNSVDGVYRSYSFDVAPATYDIYIVANVPEMADKLAGSPEAATLQTDVSGLLHSYNSGSALSLPSLTSGLPMACELKSKVVADQPVTLHAPLQFLCSKVRLTVIHDSDLGQKGLKVSQLGVENAYSPVNCFAAGETDAYEDGPLSLASGVGTGNHYAFSETLKGKTLAELAHVPTDGETDLLDFSSASPLNSAVLNTSMANVYQNICYLPESPETDATHPLTALVAKFTNASGESKTIKFPVGCNKTETDTDHLSGCNRLERGHFYDVVAKFVGGDVYFSWSVVGDWEPENLSIKLAGNTTLWIDRVDIADSSKKEMKVNGETPYKIAYTTSAPRLSFESCKIGNNPVFDIVENKEEGVLEVTLNSSVTESSSLPADLGFMVIAGNVRKWVRVKDIDAKKFFRISPESRYLYISQIVNETSYALVYEYATNMDDFTLELADYVNSNGNKGKSNLSIAVYTGVYSGTLDGLEQFTEEVAMTENDTDNKRDLKLIPVISSRSSETWPKSGVVVITIKDPSNQQAFGKQIKGTIKGQGKEGTDTKSDSGIFEINPSAQKYTIHFRDKNGGWDAPHIYVYQPLTFTYNNKEYECYNTGDDDNPAGKINWLEYSFTGKYVFRGWKAENGDVNNLSGAPIEWIHPVTNNKVIGYQIWASNAANIDNFTSDKYFEIDLIEKHRKDQKCTKCKSTVRKKDNNGGYNSLWPGVQMIYEGGANNSGWWKIELPLLAEPGKALIMFANGHDGEELRRYPGNSEPGLPLPNFASCEAWFLYDGKFQERLDFSDYERTTYMTATDKFFLVSYKYYTSWPNNLFVQKQPGDGDCPYVWPGARYDFKSSDGRVYWLFSQSQFSGNNIENYASKANNNGGDKEDNDTWHYFNNSSTFYKKSYNELPQDVKTWLSGMSISSTQIRQHYFRNN